VYVTSLDPAQQAHPCQLISICTVGFLVRNQKANSADPDQMAQMFDVPSKVYIIMEERIKVLSNPM
jgi:hypothetical protein